MTFEKCSTDVIKMFLYKTAFEANVADFTEEDINNLYSDAYRRNLYRPDILLNMHSWSLYFLKKVNKPHVRVDAAGNYFVGAF